MKFGGRNKICHQTITLRYFNYLISILNTEILDCHVYLPQQTLETSFV